jgi:DNA-3-methyladenine glycosylase II
MSRFAGPGERLIFLMIPPPIDRSTDPRAYVALGRDDPVLKRLIDVFGEPPPFEWHDGGRTGTSLFAAMTLHIVGQQISAAVAFRIYDRLAAACRGIPTAAAVLELGATRLRETGLSNAKVSYISALAVAQVNGDIDIEAMAELDDATIIAELTAIRGIGLWSAQTFLIHNLARPDVLPGHDLGIRRAMAAQWELVELPSPKAVSDSGRRWAPYRSYAAALLWRSLAPVGAESDPKARAIAAEVAETSNADSTRGTQH